MPQQNSNTVQDIRDALVTARETAREISDNVQDLAREHKVMFAALAAIREAYPTLEPKHNDYLSQLFGFRREVDRILTETWKTLGL